MAVNAVEALGVTVSLSRSLLSTLNGSDSLLFPHTELGAIALTLAFVSREFLRLLLEELASVRIDALSVSKFPAVAAANVPGC